ncbi:hypothetical protein EV702DRAFT_1235007 [Suillus placidus]|uniref:Uncharacterized protein n=1 Tax=Suillus placidus TaxID=48579 RepID=A0A9P7D197_9AGAM|nr:hypothetical protein EV702DRAFT_1235007 [Suillus placidus]
MDDGAFPALLKTLSDSSEEVLKSRPAAPHTNIVLLRKELLQGFMMNLLKLFSTDRKLLAMRRAANYPSKPALSPLNPKARQDGLLASTSQGVTTPGPKLPVVQRVATQNVIVGRIATVEAQIESMHGNLMALNAKPAKEKKKLEKKEKAPVASTLKAAASCAPKAAPESLRSTYYHHTF